MHCLYHAESDSKLFMMMEMTKEENEQVNFFVTDSVIPEPAKTTLIILYCVLITIAGDHLRKI